MRPQVTFQVTGGGDQANTLSEASTSGVLVGGGIDCRDEPSAGERSRSLRLRKRSDGSLFISRGYR